MIDKHELCEKIRALYPDIGECGIDVNVSYDGETENFTFYEFIIFGYPERPGDIKCGSRSHG